MTSFRQKTVRFQIPVFRLESYSFLPNPTQELAGARKNSAKSCRIPGKTPVSGIVQFFAESGKSSTISGVIFGKKMYKSRQRCYIWKRTVFCRKCKLTYDFAILAATKLHSLQFLTVRISCSIKKVWKLFFLVLGDLILTLFDPFHQFQYCIILSGTVQAQVWQFQASIGHFRSVPFQAGAISGLSQFRPTQSHLRPICPNSGPFYIRPNQLRSIPIQVLPKSGFEWPIQALPSSGQS